MMARSPNIFVIRMIYGVSPQPAQAPENSNSGSSNCASFTCVCEIFSCSSEGIPRKYFQYSLYFSRNGGWASMLMARCLASLLLLAGHTATHSPQPVQSSGATCSVYFRSVNSFHFGGAVWKPSGAWLTAFASYTLARMTACGQTSTHLPHWMQSCSSHTGISRAMLRFSHWAVPEGKVPSRG